MLGFFCQLPSASSCSEPGDVTTGGFTMIGTWALTATSPHIDWATVDHSSKWSQVPLEGLRGRFIEFLQNPSRGHGLLFQLAAPHHLDEIWIWIRDHGFLLQWFKLAFEHKIHRFSYCNRVSRLLVGFLETMRVRGKAWKATNKAWSASPSFHPVSSCGHTTNSSNQDSPGSLVWHPCQDWAMDMVQSLTLSRCRATAITEQLTERTCSTASFQHAYPH